ncbi:DUF305 domain-containing protein [Nocardia sp. NPDC050712]|uniref:DUF305 domain-containing protein n=1 Tax=Nocardia sp. NPDC050712 TaxID=3155518 RepID=UPI00340AE024
MKRPAPRAFLAVLTALALLGAGVIAGRLTAAQAGPAGITLSDTEIGFAQDMTAHHQQALSLVRRLDPGAEATVRQLATQIADNQRVEIGIMLGWLRLVNAPAAARVPMRWMGEHAGHDSAMPGMASTAELAALAGARGPDAETRFLQLMLRHHEGGISMARAADNLIAAGPVKEAARSMLTDQGKEAGRIGLLLSQRGAQPLR